MPSRSLYDKDYEIIEKEFTDNMFEFICNTDRKHIIGFICKFYDENGNTIKTSEDSTLDIYNIFLEDNEKFEIQRFIKPKFKEYFTICSSHLDQLKYDADQWSYFMNVRNNNFEFKFIFNLIIEKYNKINMKLILIYDRIFTKIELHDGKEYNYLGMPFLGYYLDHIPNLKYLSAD